jgi:MerR family transcriptional regulator, light-induced transcriptional regulator
MVRSSEQKLLKERGKIAARSIKYLLAKRPDLKKRLNRLALLKMHRDLSDSIANLCGSIVAEDPGLFRDHIIWTENYYRFRGINTEVLFDQMEALKKSILEASTTGLESAPCDYLTDGMAYLQKYRSGSIPTDVMQLSSSVSIVYAHLLLDMDKRAAESYIGDLLESRWEIEDIISMITQPALNEIGRLWHTNQISSRMESNASRLNREIILGLFDKGIKPEPTRGTCALYSPAGEMHDLGITILTQLLHHKSIRVLQFRPNIPDHELIELLIKNKPSVLGVSITMAYGLVPFELLTEKIKKQSELAGMKIIIGGYLANKLKKTGYFHGTDAIVKDLKQGIKTIVESIEFES